MKPPQDLRARILEAAKREPSPTLATASRARAIAVAAGFVPLLAIFELLHGYALAGRPFGYVVVQAIGWSVLTLAATWGALSRGRSMLGRPWPWLAAVAVATPIALATIACAAYAWWPEAATAGAVPWAVHARCFAFASLMALGPLAAFAYARRHTDPVHPRLTGAAVGAAAGGWGALAIAVHCPGTVPDHLLLGHVLPVVVFALVGIAIGARGVAIGTATADARRD